MTISLSLLLRTGLISLGQAQSWPRIHIHCLGLPVYDIYFGIPDPATGERVHCCAAGDSHLMPPGAVIQVTSNASSALNGADGKPAKMLFPERSRWTVRGDAFIVPDLMVQSDICLIPSNLSPKVFLIGTPNPTL